MTKIDRNKVRADLANHGEVVPTEAELDTALAAIDPDKVFAEEHGAWTVEVWDRKSPINGIDAATVLEHRTDIPETGDVYLLIRDGHIHHFQPHLPNVAGMKSIPEGEGHAHGAKHVEEIAANRTQERVIEHVRNFKKNNGKGSKN